MKNSEITKKFFASTDKKTKDSIIGEIAAHYKISKEEALAEITAPDAEHLLDYLTGGTRAATGILLRIHGLA